MKYVEKHILSLKLIFLYTCEVYAWTKKIQYDKQEVFIFIFLQNVIADLKELAVSKMVRKRATANQVLSL